MNFLKVQVVETVPSSLTNMSDFWHLNNLLKILSVEDVPIMNLQRMHVSSLRTCYNFESQFSVASKV